LDRHPPSLPPTLLLPVDQHRTFQLELTLFKPTEVGT
jgi:hypothetical protein